MARRRPRRGILCETMHRRFLLKVRAVWLLGIALVLAGLLAVLYYVALLAWQWTTALQTRSWISLPATIAFLDHSGLRARKVAPVLDYLPQLPPAWLKDLEASPLVHQAAIVLLDKLHIGVVFALLGLVVMALGALIVMRQRARLTMARRYKEDRLRRVRLYRSGETRREPYFGTVPGDAGEADVPRHDTRRTA